MLLSIPSASNTLTHKRHGTRKAAQALTCSQSMAVPKDCASGPADALWSIGWDSTERRLGVGTREPAVRLAVAQLPQTVRACSDSTIRD